MGLRPMIQVTPGGWCEPLGMGLKWEQGQASSMPPSTSRKRKKMCPKWCPNIFETHNFFSGAHDFWSGPTIFFLGPTIFFLGPTILGRGPRFFSGVHNFVSGPTIFFLWPTLLGRGPRFCPKQWLSKKNSACPVTSVTRTGVSLPKKKNQKI